MAMWARAWAPVTSADVSAICVRACAKAEMGGADETSSSVYYLLSLSLVPCIVYRDGLGRLLDPFGWYDLQAASYAAHPAFDGRALLVSLAFGV